MPRRGAPSLIRSARLQTRDDEPSSGPARVDQLIGGQASPRTQVGEVAFSGARPNADEGGSLRDKPGRGDVGGEDGQLTRGRG